MTFFEAIFLGAVQGFTEFLPISSSGHLVLTEHYFGIEGSNLTFDVVVHFASLLALIIYFNKSLLLISKRQALLIGIATLPGLLIGFLLRNVIEALFTIIAYVSIELIITGVVNILIHRLLIKKNAPRVNTLEAITPLQAVTIGLAQAVAISPGISRSGATVLVGLHQGLSREAAFRFSFLMAIPIIIAATIFRLGTILLAGDFTSNINFSVYIAGAVSAMFVGLLSLKIFEYVMKKAHMNYFGWYCIFLGGVSLLVLAG